MLIILQRHQVITFLKQELLCYISGSVHGIKRDHIARKKHWGQDRGQDCKLISLVINPILRMAYLVFSYHSIQYMQFTIVRITIYSRLRDENRRILPGGQIKEKR